jgi:hypothetical protein
MLSRTIRGAVATIARKVLQRRSAAISLGLCALAPAVAVATATSAAQPAAIRSSTQNCHTPHGATIYVRSRDGIIFEGTGGEGELCSYVTGRVVRLEATEHFNWPIASFTRYWAAVYSTGNEDPWAVTLYDMRSGKVRYEDNTIGKVDQIVLANDGALAWLQDSSLEAATPQQTTYQVVKHDRNGTALLDSSHAIKLGSLSLRGTTVRWRDGGALRTQALR